MDVTNVEEARIAEEAGAVAVMALERVPAGGAPSPLLVLLSERMLFCPLTFRLLPLLPTSMG